MTPQILRALQAQILADADCAPFIHTNDLPKISSTDAHAKDQAIADILTSKNTRPKTHLITEKGVRAALSIHEGALFIKTLRDLSVATAAPVWLTLVLTAMSVPEDAQWAYFDTLQCGYPWLRTEGLDVGESTVRQMLDLIAAGVPVLAGAAATLKALGVEPDTVGADVVSRAVRGPWGDE